MMFIDEFRAVLDGRYLSAQESLIRFASADPSVKDVFKRQIEELEVVLRYVRETEDYLRKRRAELSLGS